MNKCFKRLLRFDDIRLIKLLEIYYYTVISFLLTLTFTQILQNDNLVSFVFKTYDYKKAPILELFIDTLIDLFVLVIYIYYLKKLLSCIPSLPGYFSKKYVSNKKSEVNIGIGLGTGIIIYTALPSIKDKLKEIHDRYPVQNTLEEIKDNI